MSIVNTNYLSLASQNHINKSQRSLNTAIERLSLGTRVNSAKDDSANSSIINPFTANIKGLTQAVRNGNDGLSIAQTTEGSLTEINDSLLKIRTLTVQALNETNSSTDLQFIQDEINARLAEIDRVSTETEFNRLHVLGSDAKPLIIQIGAYDNETITIDLQQINNQTLGIAGFNITNPINESRIHDSVADKYIQSKRVPSDLGFSAPTNPHLVFEGEFGALQKTTTSAGLESYHIQVTGAFGQGANAINGWYEVSVNEQEKLTLNLDSHSSNPPDGTLSPATRYQSAIKDFTGAAADEVYAYSGKDHDYVIKDTSGSAATYYAANINSETGEVTRGHALISTEESKDPLAKLDAALQKVGDLRSHLGAVQNRLISSITNIDSSIVHLSATRSRLQDADFAVEVSNKSRLLLLQQAGTTMLAQANQVPQLVLSLLS